MVNNRYFLRRNYYLYKLFTLVFLCVLFSKSGNSQSFKLFSGYNQSDQIVPGILDEISYSKFRYVQIEQFLLDKVIAGEAVSFNFFDDVELYLDIESIEQFSNNGTIIQGKIGEYENSTFTISIFKNKVLANFNNIKGSNFKIRVSGLGEHFVYEEKIDFNAFVSMRKDDFEISGNSNSFENAGKSFNDDGSVIDLMILYTTDFRDDMGGEEATMAFANLAVAETNTFLLNSETVTSLNLVLTIETDYEETGDTQVDLTELSYNQTGVFDDEHEWRESYCADLVCMLIESGEVYGRAWLNGPWSTPDRGFSVCKASTRWFAHEIGHNLGCHHDRSLTEWPGAFDYSYGYVNTQYSIRTLMAYGTPVNLFSNPNLEHNGHPVGVDASDVENAADNVLTINNMAFHIANFKQSCDSLFTSADLIPSENAQEYISFYPNPAETKVTIKSLINSDLKVEIYDIKGGLIERMKSQRNQERWIDISSFAEGIYILKVYNENELIGHRKLIIQ